MPLPEVPNDNGCAVRPGPIAEIGCAPETIPGDFTRLLVGSTGLTTAEDGADFVALIDNDADTNAAIRNIEIFDFTMDTGDVPVDVVEGGREVPAGKAKRTLKWKTSNYADYQTYIRVLGYNKAMYFWFANETVLMGGEADWQLGISGIPTVKELKGGKGTVTKWEFTLAFENQFGNSYVATPVGIY